MKVQSRFLWKDICPLMQIKVWFVQLGPRRPQNEEEAELNGKGVWQKRGKIAKRLKKERLRMCHWNKITWLKVLIVQMIFRNRLRILYLVFGVNIYPLLLFQDTWIKQNLHQTVNIFVVQQFLNIKTLFNVVSILRLSLLHKLLNEVKISTIIFGTKAAS